MRFGRPVDARHECESLTNCTALEPAPMNPSPDLEQPFEVDQVIVSGLERTRESLVQAVLHPARNASSVSDIVQRLAEAEQVCVVRARRRGGAVRLTPCICLLLETGGA